MVNYQVHLRWAVHIVKSGRGGRENTTVLWNELQWLLVLTMSLLTKVISIIDLKVTGSGLVDCMSGFCSSFLNLSHGCLVVHLKILQMYSWHTYVRVYWQVSAKEFNSVIHYTL